MENTNNPTQQGSDVNNLSNQSSLSDNNQDTSQKGREEEVINQQDQQQATNSQDSNRETNIPTSTDSGMSNGGNKRFADDANDEGKQRYSEGMGNNSDTQDNPIPDTGKEDAEKTQRETPRM